MYIPQYKKIYIFHQNRLNSPTLTEASQWLQEASWLVCIIWFGRGCCKSSSSGRNKASTLKPTSILYQPRRSILTQKRISNNNNGQLSKNGRPWVQDSYTTLFATMARRMRDLYSASDANNNLLGFASEGIVAILGGGINPVSSSPLLQTVGITITSC